jgi:RHS repeat-associated protein
LDHLGNIHLVTDGDARVRQRTEITPFGERVEHSTGIVHPEAERTFNDHVYDAVTGLYDFGARHYDAFLGRFVSGDPSVSAELNPIGLNRYAFNANNPVRYVDPDGFGFWDVFALVLVAIAAVVVTVATFGAGAVLIAAAVGLAIGLAVGAVTGIIVSLVATGSLNLGIVAAFALAGALVGSSIGGVIACAPILIGSASAGVAGNMAALAFLGSLVGAIGSGVYHGVQTGPEAIVYGIVMGWSIGALVGLAHGGGAALVGAEFGVSLAASTAAGAIGFTPGGFGEHVLESIKGNRDFFGGPGEAPKELGPGGGREKGKLDFASGWEAFKRLIGGLPNFDPTILNGDPNKAQPTMPVPCTQDPRLCPPY